MTDKAHPEDDKPNAIFLHQERSETAATVGDDRYKPTGGQTYRVTVANGNAMIPVDVDADTGDAAAAAALAKHPGCKVAHVAPAPQRAKLSVKEAA